MPQAIQSKRDTAAAWTSANTVLAPGQIGVESNTGKMKVGVAAGTPWTSLAYIQGTPGLTRIPIRDPYAVWAPIPGVTTPAAVGTSTGSNAVDSSAASARSIATTSLLTLLPRTAWAGGNAASRMSGVSLQSGTTVLFAPSTSFAYGWKMRIAAAIADANTVGQFGIGVSTGLSAGAWTSSIQPSAMLNCVFLGGDASDPNMSIMHNGASGSCTKIDLGSLFPNNTNSTDLYELTLEFRSNGSTRTLTYTATNMTTNSVSSGSIPDTAKMPVAGTALPEFFCRGSAATTGIPTIDFYGKQIGPYA